MSLSISDPVKILTNEIVKIEVSFEIEEEFSKEDAKLTLQCNKESSIGIYSHSPPVYSHFSGLSKGDLLVKDPNQHLVFNLKSTSEKFTIWMKNETATFAEPSLLVASVSLSVDDYVCALRAERRIPPAIPFKVATKCLTNLFMPLSALSTASESFLLLVSAELLEKDESLKIPLRRGFDSFLTWPRIPVFKKQAPHRLYSGPYFKYRNRMPDRFLDRTGSPPVSTCLSKIRPQKGLSREACPSACFSADRMPRPDFWH